MLKSPFCFHIDRNGSGLLSVDTMAAPFQLHCICLHCWDAVSTQRAILHSLLPSAVKGATVFLPQWLLYSEAQSPRPRLAVSLELELQTQSFPITSESSGVQEWPCAIAPYSLNNGKWDRGKNTYIPRQDGAVYWMLMFSLIKPQLTEKCLYLIMVHCEKHPFPTLHIELSWRWFKKKKWLHR